MKAKLIFDGKEIEIEISEEFALEVTKALPVEKKKTGYERVDEREVYYSIGETGNIDSDNEYMWDEDTDYYENANYYSDRTVAENNARADQLYRRLRRFAVEHREEKIDWDYKSQWKYTICFCHSEKTLDVDDRRDFQYFGQICFDSYDTTKLAINTFHDELMWYFTEYRDSL